MLKHQAGARTKDSTSSHLSALRRGQVPSTVRRRWRRECCVAAGPRSDVRLGDSSWRFRPRAGVFSSMRSTACPRQTLHHARSTLRGLELNLCNLYTSVPRACNCKRTVTGRPRGPVRSPHLRPGQSERAAGPGRATRVRTSNDVRVRSRGAWFSRSPDADGRKRNKTIRAERPSSVTNPQGLACTGSKQQLLHAIDNALG
jgi:hypothetical protein